MNECDCFVMVNRVVTYFSARAKRKEVYKVFDICNLVHVDDEIL